MKEPDKWCIKITPENKEAIEKWRTSNVILDCKGYCVNKIFYDSSIGYWCPDKPREYTEISFEEFKVYTSKPLKQVVHCKTQEEWDFVTEKLGYKWAQHCSFSAFSESTCISLIDTQYSYVDYLKNDYQILSFQEWCDLNGHKMEKEVKFEVGDWVFAVGNIQGYDHPTIGKIDEFSIGNKYDSRVNFYNKSGSYCTIWSNVIRHATPEEIYNHSVSIGQIPAGESLNTGIKPNKDGIYQVDKKHQEDLIRQGIKIREEFFGGGKTQSLPKMILSIDDEELPMVSIIKTNTVKQLLNND